MIDDKFGGENKIWYHGPEFGMSKLYAYKDEDIFPLKKVSFENSLFYCPNNMHTYLGIQYGESYMEFPKSGVEHHGGEAGKLATWSKKEHTNMQEVLCELNTIYDKLEG